MILVNMLLNHDLLVGLPKINLEIDKVCDACQMGKQTKNQISACRPLELFHMNVFVPPDHVVYVERYTIVIIDIKFDQQ